MATSIADKRLESRVPIRWRAACKLGGMNATGLLRDISGSGAFFSAAGPEAEHDPTAEQAIEFLQQGDTVVLTFKPDWQENPVIMMATVKWIGFSRDNEVDGAGLEFEESNV